MFLWSETGQHDDDDRETMTHVSFKQMSQSSEPDGRKQYFVLDRQRHLQYFCAKVVSGCDDGVSDARPVSQQIMTCDPHILTTPKEEK